MSKYRIIEAKHRYNDKDAYWLQVKCLGLFWCTLHTDEVEARYATVEEARSAAAEREKRIARRRNTKVIEHFEV